VMTLLIKESDLCVTTRDQPPGSAEANIAAEAAGRGSLFDALLVPLTLAAIAVSAVAIPSTLMVTGAQFFPHAAYAFAIFAVWLAAALMLGLPALASAAQAVGTVGMGATFQVTPNFSVGVEARFHMVNNGGGLAPLPY